VLNDKDVDLVVVNTPTYTHYEYAKKLSRPASMLLWRRLLRQRPAEAEELKALADKKGVKISVFQNRRWDSDFKNCEEGC